MRSVVVHGHLYQPPREDPWSGDVPVEPSAEPFPNWNARITEECYRPNANARLLGPGGDVVAVENLYRRLSYNFAPTLAAWMAEHAPDVHDAIVQADGDGRAIAHPWVHAILPLCSERDRRTAVRWGIADFRHRFGREPEGMWLPETAVDLATLETLAAEGIRFTFLAPYQLAQTRPDPAERWSTTVDPRVPYRIDLPSGGSFGVIAYDGALSSDVAFNGLLHDGVAFARRIIESFGEADPALATVAVDFETYGHHHRYGEMALAKAIHELDSVEGVEVVSAAQALGSMPPVPARVAERTAWSCAHGLERWRSDCGCRSGPETPVGQSWRAPLRAGLDWLGETVAELDTLADALAEPSAARDAYGEVVAGAATWEDWVAGRLVPGGDAARARTWLELQRHLLLMASSCGWFFDDAAGHETVIVLRHAARAMELVQALGGPWLETGLVERLRPMRSMDERYPDGEAIWRGLVARR